MLGVLLLVGVLAAIVGLWRGDAPVPRAWADYVDGARQASRIDLGLGLIPLRFVEARCRGEDVAFVFEPTLPFFGRLRAYAVGHFAPATCAVDCVSAIAGVKPADFQQDWAGQTTGQCG
jgi:hypothetical protein